VAQQSGKNQLKLTVASGGIDSREGSGKQRWLTAIGNEMPTSKAILVALPTPLSLSLAGGGGWAAAAAARE
jgi:hypothetical protein